MIVITLQNIIGIAVLGVIIVLVVVNFAWNEWLRFRKRKDKE